MFTVFYDRALNPPTFDVVSFLMWTELERDGDEVAIEVLPGPREGFASNTLWPKESWQRQAMWDAVAWPMMQMLPACKCLRMATARPPRGALGFGRYMTGFENFLASYSEGIRPLRPKCDAQRTGLVTMTLRESEHWPARNSRKAEWILAAWEIKRLGYPVVIVRDTLHAAESVPGVETAPHASRNLEARAVLYRSAALNLFVSNGPAWFALAIDAPAIILRPATDGANPKSSRNAMINRYKLSKGLPNAPAHQRLIWQDDTAENIIQAAKDALT